MLYLLQVYVLVAFAILVPFFAVYLALIILRYAYLAAIRLCRMINARRLARLETARPVMASLAKNTRQRIKPAVAELPAPSGRARRSARRVA